MSCGCVELENLQHLFPVRAVVGGGELALVHKALALDGGGGHFGIVNFADLPLHYEDNWLNSLMGREHQETFCKEDTVSAILENI